MDTSVEKRKPGRPPKSPQAPSLTPVVKRGRGRPPKKATTSPVTGSGGVMEPGKRTRGRPKLNTISKVNNGGGKKRGRGRPKFTKPATQDVPVSKHRGRPPKSMVNHADVHRPLSKRLGRPPKSKANMNFMDFMNSLGGPGTAALVMDPLQLVAYKELKLKYEHLQSKAKEVVAGVSSYLNPEDDVFKAVEELDMLAGTDVNQSKAKEVVAGVSSYVNPEDDVFKAVEELDMLAGTDVNVET